MGTSVMGPCNQTPGGMICLPPHGPRRNSCGARRTLPQHGAVALQAGRVVVAPPDSRAVLVVFWKSLPFCHFRLIGRLATGMLQDVIGR